MKISGAKNVLNSSGLIWTRRHSPGLLLRVSARQILMSVHCLRCIQINTSQVQTDLFPCRLSLVWGSYEFVLFQFQKLCDLVCELLLEESNVQPVSTPVTVCGDIHGQVGEMKLGTVSRLPECFVLLGCAVATDSLVESCTCHSCLRGGQPPPPCPRGGGLTRRGHEMANHMGGPDSLYA